MSEQRGFGDDGTESARLYQSGQGDNHMNEQDEEVAHRRQSYQHLRTAKFGQLVIRHGHPSDLHSSRRQLDEEQHHESL